MLDGPQAAAHLRRRRALHRGWGLGGPWQQPAEPSARAVLRKSKLAAAVVSSMLVRLKRVLQQRTSAAFDFFSGGASASWSAFCFGIDFWAIGFARKKTRPGALDLMSGRDIPPRTSSASLSHSSPGTPARKFGAARPGPAHVACSSIEAREGRLYSRKSFPTARSLQGLCVLDAAFLRALQYLVERI